MELLTYLAYQTKELAKINRDYERKQMDFDEFVLAVFEIVQKMNMALDGI